MFIIRTQSGSLINMDLIERISIKDNILEALTPSYGEQGVFDTHYLYIDDNIEHLKEVRDLLFNAMMMKGCTGFDCSLICWEDKEE